MSSAGFSNGKAVGVISLIVVALIAVVAVAAPKHKPTVATANQQTMSSATTSSNPATSSTSSTQSYKDGTYTATGHYQSPGGEDAITISMTLSNNVVTATSATPGAIDGQSSQYEAAFIGAYKAVVVGKNLDSIDISQISGASLTNQGFEDALSNIKSQAHA